MLIIFVVIVGKFVKIEIWVVTRYVKAEQGYQRQILNLALIQQLQSCVLY